MRLFLIISDPVALNVGRLYGKRVRYCVRQKPAIRISAFVYKYKRMKSGMTCTMSIRENYYSEAEESFFFRRLK